VTGHNPYALTALAHLQAGRFAEVARVLTHDGLQPLGGFRIEAACGACTACERWVSAAMPRSLKALIAFVTVSPSQLRSCAICDARLPRLLAKTILGGQRWDIG
jgi:hypothetical protein